MNVTSLEVLSNQGVMEVKRILSKRNGMIERTNTFIITFGLPTPQALKSVKAACLKLYVEPYIPNPLRCYNLQLSEVRSWEILIANEKQFVLNVPNTVTISKIGNSPSTSAQTEDCGAVGGHAKNQIKSNVPHYKPVENKKQGNSKLEPTSSKLIGKRPAKGSDIRFVLTIDSNHLKLLSRKVLLPPNHKGNNVSSL